MLLSRLVLFTSSKKLGTIVIFYSRVYFINFASSWEQHTVENYEFINFIYVEKHFSWNCGP